MSISDASESSILSLIFNATAWANVADNAGSSPITQIAAAFHTADPGDAGNMATSEIAYSGYARANTNRNSGGFTVTGPSPTSVSPAAIINFPIGSAGTSPTATHFSFGKTGGGAAQIFYSGTLTPNVLCGNGITPQLTPATVCTLD